MGRLTPLSPQLFRKFLSKNGWAFSRTKGGHEIWNKPGAIRPVVFQPGDDVPVFELMTNLRTMGLTREELLAWLEFNR